jgi:hypothetical protein
MESTDGLKRFVLHRDRGYCSDAGSACPGPTELYEQQLLIGRRPRVAGEDELAPIAPAGSNSYTGHARENQRQPAPVAKDRLARDGTPR